jgi:hypothetical protein
MRGEDTFFVKYFVALFGMDEAYLRFPGTKTLENSSQK